MIKISIVIPTLGRRDELDSCIQSIVQQAYKNIELIVVDQNCPNFMDDIIQKYEEDIDIKHLKIGSKGVSRAKNHAVAFAEGEYIFFLDDDAEVFSDTLVNIISILSSKNLDVLFGRCIDREGKNSVIDFHPVESYLSIDKHKNMFVESTMVIRRDLFQNNLFDESLGVGVFHGAEEGYDLVLRLLKKNKAVFYTPDFMIYHPQKINNYAGVDVKRVFTYRCGYAKFCKKHSLNFLYFKRLFLVCFYIPICILLRNKKARYYAVEFLALLSGRLID